MKRIVITVGPEDRPYARIYLTEKRSGQKDRRKSHTFFAQDRRSGIDDRRKIVKFIHLDGF